MAHKQFPGDVSGAGCAEGSLWCRIYDVYLPSSTGTCCVCVCMCVCVCVCMWICVGGYVVESISCYFHFPLLNIFLKLSVFFGVYLINHIVLVSCVQQRDSVSIKIYLNQKLGFSNALLASLEVILCISVI